MNYTYLERIPAPPLNAYIHDIYCWSGAAPYPRMKVVPLPALHLMVNLGEPFRVYAPNCAEPVAVFTDSLAVGLWNTYHIVDWPPQVLFYGVHFRAGGAYPFFGQPLSELHNQVVALDALWGDFAAELRERLYDASNIPAGLALFEYLLLQRLCDAPHGLNIVEYAIAEIGRQRGGVSIRALSDDIGISQNHLKNQFKRMVGIPPKELARLERFGHLYRAVDGAQNIDWTRLAHSFGYYDQSHFNKDFMAFVGHSPTDFLRLRRLLDTVDPEHDGLLRPFPVD